MKEAEKSASFQFLKIGGRGVGRQAGKPVSRNENTRTGRSLSPRRSDTKKQRSADGENIAQETVC